LQQALTELLYRYSVELHWQWHPAKSANQDVYSPVEPRSFCVCGTSDSPVFTASGGHRIRLSDQCSYDTGISAPFRRDPQALEVRHLKSAPLRRYLTVIILDDYHSHVGRIHEWKKPG
jgi:hypothetical protein